MDQRVLTVSPRLVAISPKRTPISFSQSMSSWLLPTHQHPALSYGPEEVSIHHSLDLSFQHGIAVSPLDREIIDDLTRIEQPL